MHFVRFHGSDKINSHENFEYILRLIKEQSISFTTNNPLQVETLLIHHF